MTGERTEKALARMDLALRRIEAAAARAQTSLADQARKNQVLRQAVTEALRDLDSVIGRTDPAAADPGTTGGGGAA